ncbi:hypothetical protein PRECH8_07050 [Insulibacter thermoxylanivorax]|uniref:Uncharacterized protein n=1 Tax=Insulibacter thermoxylanivorax TaxID=2749268 RepID=A0A916QD74_9BACL|nr:hypothetical protein [Insulibacter thermoxylanivorax]GFR37409.1 hypothetical protein PRECH8_07050 [Insulibacter thermoxylanivorax]
MQTIIAIIILFWIFTALNGARGKQPGRGLQRPQQKIPGMPPFGVPKLDLPPVKPLERSERPVSREAEARSGGSGRRQESSFGDPGYSDYPSYSEYPSRSDYSDYSEMRTLREASEIQRDDRSPRITRSSRITEEMSAAPYADELGDDLESYNYDQDNISLSSVSGDIWDNELSPNRSVQQDIQIKPQQVVSGILWSEIFGPPKARRTRR